MPFLRFSFSFFAFVFLCLFALTHAQNDNKSTCGPNQIFNGQQCACGPGYFDKSSKDRCEDECGEEFQSSLFVYGECFQFGKNAKTSVPCNFKCAVRLRLWTIFALFAVIAGALVVLALILPMCVINCFSCLHSKKASKHSKRMAIETQQMPSKEQQLQSLSYNPYSYWPYYGR